MTTYLKCACCGEFAGYWLQFHNQDTGWGMCKSCADRILVHRPFGHEPITRSEFDRTYGIEGVNWGAL